MRSPLLMERVAELLVDDFVHVTIQAGNPMTVAGRESNPIRK